jgi:hypothetical protein
MAKLGFNYSGDTEELNSNDFDRSPLPEGKYNVEILDSDYRDTKTGTGSYVMVEFSVLDPEYAGKKIWANYNIVNSNPKAQEIGEQQFAKLCLAALGKPSCSDTDELIGRQVAVGVGFEKNDPSRNRVKWSEAVQQTTSAPAPRAAAAPTAAPSVAKPANPWQKSK